MGVKFLMARRAGAHGLFHVSHQASRMILRMLLCGFLMVGSTHERLTAADEVAGLLQLREKKTSVDQAFDSAMSTASKEYLSQLDAAIKRATDKGSLEDVENLTRARDLFTSTRVLPETSSLRSLNERYRVSVRNARLELMRELDRLVKESTRSGQLEYARQIRDEQNALEQEFREDDSVKPPIRPLPRVKKSSVEADAKLISGIDVSADVGWGKWDLSNDSIQTTVEGQGLAWCRIPKELNGGYSLTIDVTPVQGRPTALIYLPVPTPQRSGVALVLGAVNGRYTLLDYKGFTGPSIRLPSRYGGVASSFDLDNVKDHPHAVMSRFSSTTKYQVFVLLKMIDGEGELTVAVNSERVIRYKFKDSDLDSISNYSPGGTRRFDYKTPAIAVINNTGRSAVRFSSAQITDFTMKSSLPTESPALPEDKTMQDRLAKAKVSELWIEALANNNKVSGSKALAALDEILKLDPDNIEARKLYDKLSASNVDNADMRDHGRQVNVSKELLDLVSRNAEWMDLNDGMVTIGDSIGPFSDNENPIAQDIHQFYCVAGPYHRYLDKRIASASATAFGKYDFTGGQQTTWYRFWIKVPEKQNITFKYDGQGNTCVIYNGKVVAKDSTHLVPEGIHMIVAGYRPINPRGGKVSFEFKLHGNNLKMGRVKYGGDLTADPTLGNGIKLIDWVPSDYKAGARWVPMTDEAGRAAAIVGPLAPTEQVDRQQMLQFISAAKPGDQHSGHSVNIIYSTPSGVHVATDNMQYWCRIRLRSKIAQTIKLEYAGYGECVVYYGGNAIKSGDTLRIREGDHDFVMLLLTADGKGGEPSWYLKVHGDQLYEMVQDIPKHGQSHVDGNVTASINIEHANTTDKDKLESGLVRIEYPRHESQASDAAKHINIDKLGRILNVSILSMAANGDLATVNESNNVFVGVLKVDRPGPYQFKIYGHYTGGARMYVGGVLVDQHLTNNGSLPITVNMKDGYIPVSIYGRIGNRKVTLNWMRPGDSGFAPIPASVMYYRRDVLAAIQDVVKRQSDASTDSLGKRPFNDMKWLDHKNGTWNNDISGRVRKSEGRDGVTYSMDIRDGFSHKLLLIGDTVRGTRLAGDITIVDGTLTLGWRTRDLQPRGYHHETPLSKGRYKFESSIENGKHVLVIDGRRMNLAGDPSGMEMFSFNLSNKIEFIIHSLELTSGSQVRRIPPDAVEFQGNSYLIYVVPDITWEKARAMCKDMGGDLAVSSTAEEFRFLAELVANHDKPNFWIGGRVQDGTLKWIDGSVIDQSYWHGVTNKDDKNKLYVYINSVRSIANDKSPHSNIPGFICEWPGKSK